MAPLDVNRSSQTPTGGTPPIRIVWLAPYAVPLLEPAIQLARRTACFHPASWLVHLSRALAALPGVDLHIVTLSQLVASSQVARVENVTFHVLKCGIPFTNRGFPPWLPVDLLTGFTFEIGSLLKEVAAIQPDVVHAHGTEAAYALAAVRTGRPCVVSIQGVVNEICRANPTFRFRVVARLERSVLQNARFFMCRTNFDSGYVSSLNPQAKIFKIHEAMNPLFFANDWNDADGARVLFVGSLVEHKGLPLLLQAMGRVKERIPHCQLRVVGLGSESMLAQMRTLVDRLGFSANVEFLGFQTPEQIARHQRECQVFVLPSRIENSPNTLAEAMVSGMPVIATRVGGVPSMIEDGVTGVLVPQDDATTLATEIVELLQHPEERRHLGENARCVARERHAPSAVATATRQAYEEILRREQSDGNKA
jgi:glycosyltransferase involved in cell wall biosynthesis